MEPQSTTHLFRRKKGFRESKKTGIGHLFRFIFRSGLQWASEMSGFIGVFYPFFVCIIAFYSISYDRYVYAAWSF